MHIPLFKSLHKSIRKPDVVVVGQEIVWSWLTLVRATCPSILVKYCGRWKIVWYFLILIPSCMHFCHAWMLNTRWFLIWNLHLNQAFPSSIVLSNPGNILWLKNCWLGCKALTQTKKQTPSHILVILKYYIIFGPHRTACLQDFWQCIFTYSKFRYDTFQKANNKGAYPQV